MSNMRHLSDFIKTEKPSEHVSKKQHFLEEYGVGYRSGGFGDHVRGGV